MCEFIIKVLLELYSRQAMFLKKAPVWHTSSDCGSKLTSKKHLPPAYVNFWMRVRTYVVYTFL